MREFYKHAPYLCTLDNKDAIVWIPKNASSLIRLAYYRRHGEDSNWRGIDWRKHRIDQFHVILRDPYKRWISGMQEFYLHNQDKEEMILDTIEKIEFDEHTVPQSDFLLQPKRNDNNTRTIRYYDLETDGLEKLNNKFNWFKEIPLHYSATDFPAKVQFKEKLDKVIDKRLIKKVKQFYSSDYDLRERVFRL